MAKSGLSYSHSGCLKRLWRSGVEYLQPKALLRVADEDTQAELTSFYQDFMTKLAASKVVYFADALHLEYQIKPAFGSLRKGSNPAIKTTTRRVRVNTNGAVCLENFDVSFVKPVTVDRDSAVQLLTKLEANGPSKSLIHAVWEKFGLPTLRGSQKIALTFGMP